MKIFGNSFFGSYGCPMIFPFGDIDAAEKTTCIGRMSLRLMISHFTNIGYTPIVGDSFTGDTPLFIKYKNTDLIDIVPIDWIMNIKETEIDALGREYDKSNKNFLVLCRSGWVEPSYIYRHKTDKPIYRVTDDKSIIDVTEDHSLFNDDKIKIKPSEITTETKLEYYNNLIDTKTIKIDKTNYISRVATLINENKSMTKLPIEFINMDESSYKTFNKQVRKDLSINDTSKSVLAALHFLKMRYGY